MWVAKIQVVIEHADGSQALRTEKFLEDMELKRVYKAAMHEVRSYVAEDDEGCKIAAIYKDMEAWEANEDDATKADTEALYTIIRGELGGIDVFDHRQIRITEVRKDGEGSQKEKNEASEANITPSSITMNFENKSEYHFGW